MGAPRSSQRSRLGLSRQGGRHDRRRRKENETYAGWWRSKSQLPGCLLEYAGRSAQTYARAAASPRPYGPGQVSPMRIRARGLAVCPRCMYQPPRPQKPAEIRTMLVHARHMTPTAAASVGARRRRPSPPTDGSHGRAVSKNLGRCAPAGCSATSGRSPETPGSLPSTPGPEGERQWSAASATLRSAPRPHRLRRASMARRSTAACSVCSWHSVQPRQAL